MASDWPRNGSVRASSALPLRFHITAGGGSAARRQRTNAAALRPRPPTTISPSTVRTPMLLLEGRQHLLDHLGVVEVALVDLALDREDPEHAAFGRRVVEAGVAAQS